MSLSELSTLRKLLLMYGPDYTDDNEERLRWKKEAEVDEQRRRDEKRGLYGEHVDTTN